MRWSNYEDSILRIVRCIIFLMSFAIAGCGGDDSSQSRVGDNTSTARRTNSKSGNSDKVRGRTHDQTPTNKNFASNGKTESDAGFDDSGNAEPPASNDVTNDSSSQPEKPAARNKTPRVPRSPDLRPRHDDERLASAGIFKYESKRLILYTDIDPEIARTLPALLDQTYVAWQDYFGPLPPARDGSEFQMTGYLIKDRDRFQKCGLLPRNLPIEFHGQQSGYEFWMNDPTQDYYRRHLLIHEGTHCYMTAIPGIKAPLWYMEGMAELFATHTVDANGKLNVRVMPDGQQHFLGWGRISLIQREVSETGVQTLKVISALKSSDEIKVTTYAWVWALSSFLDSHPRYRDRFGELARDLGRADFKRTFHGLYSHDLPDIWTEWPVFAASLKHGYDFERMAIKFQRGEPLKAVGESKSISIAVDRGWQSSHILVRQGEEYEVKPDGRFTVAQKPKPWVSEANGISFRYCDGRPLGMLLAAIRCETGTGELQREPMLDTIPIGSGRKFIAATTGTLYFRINDFPGELDDNAGSLKIEVRQNAE